jgi:hypothetical protein
MNATQRLLRDVKSRQNGEISSSVTPRTRKNGFIIFDADALTALTVLQSCAATATSPSAEMGTGPPPRSNSLDLL